MARPLRVQYKDGWYHVVNRGINRADIYLDDRDREHFLELMETAVGRLCLEIHGFALKDNHCHLILRVPEGNLSQCMQWLNVSYSIWFNRRHGRVGPLFQGRYKSVPVNGGAWLCQLSQYVHLNPVRISCLGLDKRRRRLERLGIGTDSFRDTLKCQLSHIDREMPCKQELWNLKSFSDVVRAVETVKGEAWRDFSKRHGDWGRDMVLILARKSTGMTLKEIGIAAGGMDYSAVSEAINGCFSNNVKKVLTNFVFVLN